MQENSPVHDLVISNAQIFDGEKILDGLHSVGIAKDRISFLGPSAPPARKEIDAAGRFLMPGLIDCHVHLLDMWTALDEASMEADINGELKTRLHALLGAGVTTVKSVGDPEDDILRVRELLGARDLAGPTLYTTGAAFAAPGSHPATTVFGKNPWIRNRCLYKPEAACRVTSKRLQMAKESKPTQKIDKISRFSVLLARASRIPLTMQR